MQANSILHPFGWVNSVPGAWNVHNERRIMHASLRENFEKSVKEEIPVLYRVAVRLCGNGEKAEDLVQNTLLNAYKAYDRFDGRHLRSWLISILRNEFFASLRKKEEDLPLDLAEEVVGEEPFWAEMEWRQAASRILEEVDKLPPDFKMTLLLCDVEQMTYEQVATSMDVPVGTVRSRLFRARATIRRKLGVALSLSEEN